jgi:DNA-directed RNA polymerase subunit RPC12/RpoP
MDIAKFKKLPDGYSYRTERDAGGKIFFFVVGSAGKEMRLVGGKKDTLAFAEAPDVKYSIADVRDVLLRAEVGDGEEYFQQHYGYGIRTKEFFDTCRADIGLLRYEIVEDLTVDDAWENIGAGAVNGSDIFAKKNDDGYVGAFQWMSGDAAFEERYYFASRPTAEQVWKAHVVEEAATKLAIHTYREAYTCWECGKKVEHWLDVPGKFEEKYHGLREKYCGC